MDSCWRKENKKILRKGLNSLDKNAGGGKMRYQKNLRGTLKIFDISESLGQTKAY